MYIRNATDELIKTFGQCHAIKGAYSHSSSALESPTFGAPPPLVAVVDDDWGDNKG